MSVGSINGSLSLLLTAHPLRPSGAESREVGAEHDGDADDGAKTNGSASPGTPSLSASAAAQSGRVNILA